LIFFPALLSVWGLCPLAVKLGPQNKMKGQHGSLGTHHYGIIGHNVDLQPDQPGIVYPGIQTTQSQQKLVLGPICCSLGAVS